MGQQGPWHLNKSPLMLDVYPNKLTNLGQILDEVSFWVHLCNLPINRHDYTSFTKIEKRIDHVINLDLRDGFQWNKYAMAKVSLNVNMPLSYGVIITNSRGNKVWMSFKYEHLLNFCYICGLSNDTKIKCPQNTRSPFKQNQLYGSFLRASPINNNFFYLNIWSICSFKIFSVCITYLVIMYQS